MRELTPAQVFDVLTAANRTADMRIAERIAQEIRTYGDIDRAIAGLGNDGTHAILSELLSYRAALAEIADPRLRIARLHREAADLDARAEPLWTEAAEFAGRASFRTDQGEGELADLFQRKVEVAEQMASELESDALTKRLEAAGLQAAMALREAFDSILKAVAA